jgi:hypothetical protein
VYQWRITELGLAGAREATPLAGERWQSASSPGRRTSATVVLQYRATRPGRRPGPVCSRGRGWRPIAIVQNVDGDIVANWVERVEKHGAADINVDEQIVAAMPMQIPGTAKRQAIGGVFGAAAVMAATRRSMPSTVSPGTTAAGFPAPPVVVAVAGRRLLVWKMSEVTARPKELVGILPMKSISSVEIGKGRLAKQVRFVFADGSVYEAETPTAAHPEAFAEAVARIVG